MMCFFVGLITTLQQDLTKYANIIEMKGKKKSTVRKTAAAPTHKRVLLPEDSEISMRLAHYDDIFSDFDIRPYTHRALSVDFIHEIKRATLDKNDSIELAFYLAKKSRHESREITIKERLAAHFKRHYGLLVKDKRHILRVGYGMVTMGVLCMIAATYILYKDPSESLLLSFLVVFLEPAAWFLLWEGMDQIIFNSKNINPDLEFYRKMSHPSGRIHFKSY